MSAFNPLVDYYAPGSTTTPPTASNGGATMGATMGPSPLSTANAAALQGTAPLTGLHNLPLHVGFLALLALAIVILIRKLGFRFSAVGKIGVGRG